MNIYTRGGDKGITSLIHTKNVSKSDDRIQLVGSIDELTSHLGLVKTMLRERRETGPAAETQRAATFLEEIQQTLITVMSGVADPYNKDYRIGDEKTEAVEAEIDHMEALFERPKYFILPGQNRLSAEIDIARTVARRAERALASVSVKFGSDNGTKKYMNRLADYLYVLARYEDAKAAGSSRPEAGENENRTSPAQYGRASGAGAGEYAAEGRELPGQKEPYEMRAAGGDGGEWKSADQRGRDTGGAPARGYAGQNYSKAGQEADRGDRKRGRAPRQKGRDRGLQSGG